MTNLKPGKLPKTIRQFLVNQRRKDFNEAKMDLSGLKEMRSLLPFNVRALPMPTDRADKNEVGIQKVTTLRDALRTLLIQKRKEMTEHPLTCANFEVRVVMASGRYIDIPVQYWGETLHELLHELNFKHDDERMPAFIPNNK
jgi:hypothetical protein